MQGRKRGGQPGNQNAVTHGRFSRLVKESRQVESERRHRRHAEWLMTIPKTDYAAICAAIEAGTSTKH